MHPLVCPPPYFTHCIPLQGRDAADCDPQGGAGRGGPSGPLFGSKVVLEAELLSDPHAHQRRRTPTLSPQQKAVDKWCPLGQKLTFTLAPPAPAPAPPGAPASSTACRDSLDTLGSWGSGAIAPAPSGAAWGSLESELAATEVRFSVLEIGEAGATLTR